MVPFSSLLENANDFLPLFFISVFNINFSSIFSRFQRGFGKVLGSQNGWKINILAIFLDTLFETLIFVEFCSIFAKIDG